MITSMHFIFPLIIIIIMDYYYCFPQITNFDIHIFRILWHVASILVGTIYILQIKEVKTTYTFLYTNINTKKNYPKTNASIYNNSLLAEIFLKLHTITHMVH